MPRGRAKYPELRVQMPESEEQYPKQIASEGVNIKKKS